MNSAERNDIDAISRGLALRLFLTTRHQPSPFPPSKAAPTAPHPPCFEKATPGRLLGIFLLLIRCPTCRHSHFCSGLSSVVFEQRRRLRVGLGLAVRLRTTLGAVVAGPSHYPLVAGNEPSHRAMPPLQALQDLVRMRGADIVGAGEGGPRLHRPLDPGRRVRRRCCRCRRGRRASVAGRYRGPLRAAHVASQVIPDLLGDALRDLLLEVLREQGPVTRRALLAVAAAAARAAGAAGRRATRAVRPAPAVVRANVHCFLLPDRRG